MWIQLNTVGSFQCGWLCVYGLLQTLHRGLVLYVIVLLILYMYLKGLGLGLF